MPGKKYDLLLRIIRLFHKSQTVSCDLSERNCLVGIVKNEFQLEMNIKHNFYHIPAKFLYELDFPVKYVALYQSIKNFGDSAGIRYYGEVESYKIMQRKDITYIPRDVSDPYFCFNVKQWNTLERVIKPLEIANIMMLTNFELLKRSEYIPELYMRSEEEYCLFAFLKEICLKKTRPKRSHNFHGTKIGLNNESIEVIFPNGVHNKYDRKIYDDKPFSLFRTIIIGSVNNRSNI